VPSAVWLQKGSYCLYRFTFQPKCFTATVYKWRTAIFCCMMYVVIHVLVWILAPLNQPQGDRQRGTWLLVPAHQWVVPLIFVTQPYQIQSTKLQLQHREQLWRVIYKNTRNFQARSSLFITIRLAYLLQCKSILVKHTTIQTEAVWTRWWGEKVLATTGTRSADRPSRSPALHHWATPTPAASNYFPGILLNISHIEKCFK
jgi:hypothetical protein